MNDFDPLHTRTIKLGLQINETDLQWKRIGTNGKLYGIACYVDYYTLERFHVFSISYGSGSQRDRSSFLISFAKS